MRTKLILIASAAVVLALPALAQQVAQPRQRRAHAGDTARRGRCTTDAGRRRPRRRRRRTKARSRKSRASSTSNRQRRRSNIPAGRGAIHGPSAPLEPANAGLSGDAWGGASGAFLSTLMRRMHTPLASRWAHIALRDALARQGCARRPNVNPIDWVAERAWLLLRMGEADAARMLVAGVDADRFTPKMVQVAVQSALANADPPALCPLEDGIQQI